MSTLHRSWVAACAALSLATLPVALCGQDDGKPKPVAPQTLVVGTVDFDKAFNAYPRTAKEHERLQKIADGSKKQVEQLTARIEELKASIATLAEGSFEREAKQFDLEMAMQQRQGLAKLLGDQLDAERMRVQLAIYEDLDAAIQRLAQDRGVQLVLRAEPMPPAPGADKASLRDVRERVITFERRQVWFAAQQLDLTADLIKLLQVWPLDDGKDKPKAPAAPAGGNGGGL